MLLNTGKVATELPEPAMVSGENTETIPIPAGRVALRVTFPVNAPMDVTVRLNPFWKPGALNPVLCATEN